MGVKTMTYYKRNRARILELARKYREANRAEINRKQRERYATDEAYRKYQADYHEEYRRLYGGGKNHAPDSNA